MDLSDFYRQGLDANEKIGASLATSLVEEGYGMTLSTEVF